MNFGVGRIGVLIGQYRVRRFLRDAPRGSNVMIRRIRLRSSGHNDHVCAERLQITNLLLAAFVGHYKDAAIAFDRAGERQADARVAARRLDHCAAGFELAQTFGAFDHRLADAVFDAPPRIERFDLGQQQRLQSARELVEFD